MEEEDVQRQSENGEDTQGFNQYPEISVSQKLF